MMAFIYGVDPPEMGIFLISDFRSVWKGRDFTSEGMWKGKEIYHFGRKKAQKR